MTRLLLSLLGTFLAWAVAGTELGSSLHFALISHEICSEHGELVHSGDHASAHHATHPVKSVSEGTSEDAHEHCQLLGRPEERLALAAPIGVEIVAPRVSDVSLAPQLATPLLARDTRLLSAPKTSPPA